MLKRKRQVAAKLESIEGVAETLAAADAKILAYDPKVSHDPEIFTRDPVRSSLSQVGKIIGKRPASLAFKLELRGSGTKTTDPEWIKLIQACGFASSALKSIAIGAIASGPFQHGEIITGGTSHASGRVVFNTVNGDAKIYYVSISTGELASGEVLTGSKSAATATTSGTPVSEGKEYRPVSSDASSLTMGSYEDGVLKTIKGARGTVKFNFKSGQPVMMDFNFQGVEAGIADTALLASISHESQKPPALLSASLLLDAYAARIGEMNIDINNNLASRDDINDSRSILSFLITGKTISGSLNPEMVTAATYDFYTKYFANTEAILSFIVGATTGNKFRFYAPRLQITKLEDDERDGIQLLKVSFDLNGSIDGEDDFCFVQL
ncbi:MAG: phage tail tube protein [Candidatus Omnitrophica bacterium]|nr:phage tail tube protein [Candidatus Omnitrophota bacterium]